MKKDTDKYIYFSFMSGDFSRIRRYLRAVETAGYTVKYDRSLNAWNSENAKNIENCAVFISFVSNKSADDPKVTSEINYASAHAINMITVMIDDFAVKNSIGKILGGSNLIRAYRLHPSESSKALTDTLDKFFNKNKRSSPARKYIIAGCAALSVMLVCAFAFLVSHSGKNRDTASLVSQGQAQVDIGNEDGGVIESISEIPKNEELILTIQTPFGENDPSEEAYKALLSSYDKHFDNVRFKDTTSDYYSYQTELANEFSSNSLPDIFVFNYEMLSSLTAEELNCMADVDTIRNIYKNYGENIYSGAIENIRDRVTKKCYALPIRGYWEGLFCNTDVFAVNNVELPTDWNKMTAAVNTLADGGITPISASIGVVPNYITDYLILSAAGYDDYNRIPESYSQVPQSWLTGLDFFKNLFDMKAFPKNTDSTLDTDSTELFIQKKAAMKVDGSWLCSSLTDVNDVTVIPFPTVSGGAKSADEIIGGFSSGWAISSAAFNDPKKREYCVGLIKYLTSKQNLGKFVLVSGAPPGEFDCPNNLPLVNDGNKMAAAALSGNNAFSSPLKNNFRNMTEFYASVMDVMNGDISPEDALKLLFENKSE